MQDDTKLNLLFIKEKRTSLGLTHQQIAEQLSFKNASTYFKYDNGTYSFKADHLPKLANILQCNINVIFSFMILINTGSDNHLLILFSISSTPKI